MPYSDATTQRLYAKEWRRRRWEEAVAYLGGHCVVCGSIETLEFHHRDPTLKSFVIAKSLSRKWASVILELDKCELRCKEHHDIEHAAEHGTVARYKGPKKCRCAACRAAASARRQRQKIAARSITS